MRKTVDMRLAFVLLAVAVLTLGQLLLRGQSSGGGMCVKSLATPSADDHPASLYTFYGFPLTFMTTATEGCFENRTTQVEWHVGGLLVDSLFIGCLSTLPYWFSLLWRRFQRHNIAQADTRKNE